MEAGDERYARRTSHWGIPPRARPRGLRSCIASEVALALLLAACAPATPAATPTSDPDSPVGKGYRVYQASCAACHALEEDVVVLGPSLAHIAARAGTRVEGLTAEEYLRESIVRPDDYVVEGYPGGTMRQDFALELTSDEVDQLIAFLMTQK